MKVLGLDLGVASIGWSLIEFDNEKILPNKLLGLGSCIVNLSNDETNAFTKASGITPCAQRTSDRTARKMLKRWKNRRKHLQNYLHSLGMYDRNDTLETLPPLALWELRANAANPTKRLTLKELGRVLLHLSSKRGYRHIRQRADPDSKDTAFVEGINRHYDELRDSGMTLGQLMYQKLKQSETPSGKGTVVTFRIKEGDANISNLLPRKAHEEELAAILKAQRQYYPEVLTDETIGEIHNIIFYQRPLKSCKNLVSRCEMFDFKFKNSRDRIVNANPRVAPRTSPVAQLTRIWETVNNIRLINNKNKMITPNGYRSDDIKTIDYRKTLEKFELTPDEKRKVVDFLFTHDKMTVTELLKLLGLKRSDGFKSELNFSKGIKGNPTYVNLYNALEGDSKRDDLLRFETEIVKKIDPQTGEVVLVVGDSIVQQPLYRLWHLIYSIPEEKALRNSLEEQFCINDPKIQDALVNIDFKSAGYSNRSVKFMRRILPYLMEGKMYSEACEAAGFRHSDYITAEENEKRELAVSISQISKGQLRQPLVEKVLNQMVNLVNAIIDRYGPIDEIRVELARELKQSKEQRVKTEREILANEKQNSKYASLIAPYGVKINRRTLQKYRMWEETQHRCIYCNEPIDVASFLSGDLSEVEHIIPRSLFFDDSLSNKTCSCSHCNRIKGQMTAYDFMKQKGNQALADFQKRVEELAEKKQISHTKLKRFLTAAKDIPEDFIERDLQQTRYISRKAMEILRSVCRNVYASSGKVTDFFRNAWGYNRLLEELNIERYERAGMVDHNGSRMTIREWTKRLDHRHHAVDALVVALTRQGYVQRLSTLSASRDKMRSELGEDYTHDYSLLEQWAASRPHFTPATVMNKLERMAVTFKSGKKATTPGFRAKDSIRIDVPRGPLHEDTIYGTIYIDDGMKTLSKCIKNPDCISDTSLRKTIADLIERFGGDIKEVLKYLKKHPLLSADGQPMERIATRCKEYVKRERVDSLNTKQVEKIVDDAVREAVRGRLRECGDNEKEFQQSFASRPLYLTSDSPFPIKRVTRKTGLKESSMVAVRYQNERPIGYAKTGNNHHIAFYEMSDGEIIEVVVSFWTAVKRRKFGLPSVITNVGDAWEKVEQRLNDRDAETVATSLPPIGSKLMLTLAQNDMVVIGLDDDRWHDALESDDLATIMAHLYRVQKLTSGDYFFRHHTHTLTTEDQVAKDTANYMRITGMKALKANFVRKVEFDRLGNLIISRK